MTAGELVLVVVAVLGTIALAALATTLVRVRNTLGELRREVADLRAETMPLLAELRESAAEARAAVIGAQADPDRFDRVIGSTGVVSAAIGNGGKGRRVRRTAFSGPVIKAAGLATGTSRAVKRLRTGT